MSPGRSPSFGEASSWDFCKFAHRVGARFARIELTSASCAPSAAFQGTPMEMVFIRAPKIVTVGDGVEVLAKEGDDVVAVRQGHVVAATFHPELTDDTRMHAMFLGMV